MPYLLQCLLVSLMAPTVISIYATIRKPAWHEETNPKWWVINLASAITGAISGIVASVIMMRRSITDPWMLLAVAETMSVLAWLSVSCSITDFSVKRIDRHMLRPVLFVQTIVSLVFMWHAFSRTATLAVGPMRFSAFSIGATGLLVLIALVIVAGYMKAIFGLAPSDARCLACMLAMTYPFLQFSTIIPVILFLVVLVITGMYIFTHDRSASNADIYYDKKGQPHVKELDDSKHQSRISGNRMKVPAGHAITIPFLVVMFAWLCGA